MIATAREPKATGTSRRPADDRAARR